MSQAQTIQKIIKNAVTALAGLVLLSNSVMAEDLLNTSLEYSGEIKPAGWLSNSFYEHSGSEFVVEIGDKARDDEKMVKFQAEPIREDNWLSRLTKIAGFDDKLGVEFGLLDNTDSDLTGTALTDPSWWDRVTNKLNQSGEANIDGQVLTVNDDSNNLVIKYSPLTNGLKEEIVIAGDQEVTNIFSYQLRTDANVLINKAVSGNVWNLPVDTIYFTDRDGNYFAHFLSMTATDANGNVTNSIKSTYESIGNNIYLLIVEVDENWMFSADRQYPVTIDPSIVHDTQGEFNNGTSLNRVEVTSDPKVQITDLPVGADIHSVGLWHIDETSGTNVADFSGNSSTGTANGSPSIITGQFGNARNFNGSSQYISLANNNSVLKIPGDITIEAWVRKPDSTAGHIVRRDDWANYALYADSVAYAWYYDYTCSGSAQMVTGVTNIADNQWHHITYSKLGNNMSLYVDGRLDATTNATVTLACTANSPVHIGAGVNSSDNPDTYFKGDIDEVQIYNAALSPDDILAHAQLKPYGIYTSEVIDTGTTDPIFNSFSWNELGVQTGDGETDLTTNGLVAHWKLNETSGTTATDSSGNGHTGTLTNMTTSGQDAAYNSGWTANNRKWGAGAVMFDGSNDYIDLAKTPTVKNQSTVTIASWVKVNSLSNYSTIYYETNNTSGYSRILFYILADGSVVLGGRDGDGTPSFQNFATTRTGLIKIGQWYHLIGVYDATTDQHKIYINGQDSTYTTVAGNTFPNTDPADNILLGATSSTYGNLIMDSTRMYFRALDVNEVNSLYQAGNVQLQTRTGTDASPDDGSWEAWQPSGGGVETQIDNFDNNEVSANVFETGWSNAGTNQNWVKKNNATASTRCDSGSACGYSDGRMALGNSGRGDDAHVYSGNVFKDGSIYRMYYPASDGATWRVYLATSPDGLTWTKYDNNIEAPSDTTGTNGRIPLGSTAGTGDDAGVLYPSVMKDGSTYKAWYVGYDGTKYRIYYATSSDGLTWTKVNNAIPTTCDSGSACSYGDGRLGLGTTGKGDDNQIIAFNVIKDGSTYKMYYTGDDGTDRHIFMATSADGLTWTKYDNALPADSDNISTNGRIPTGSSGTGDDKYVMPGTVIKEGGYYRLWYSGYDGALWRGYYAISSDGLTWKKVNNTIPADSNTIAYNGQIPQGITGSGDDDHILLPRVLYENGIYKAWYGGEDGSAYRIYHATMTPLPCKNTTDTNIKMEGASSEKFTSGQSQPDAATVGLWHLDETGGGGAYLKDSSANGYHLTPTGTLPGSGISQLGRSFDGASDVINRSVITTQTTNLSMEGWYYWRDSSAIAYLFYNGTTASNGYGLRISDGSSSAGNEIGLMLGGVTYDAFSSTTIMPTNQWTHIVLTRDSSTWNLYVDGVLKHTATTAPITPTGNTFLGSMFDGIIDEAKFSNVARTAEEIAEAYRLGREHRFHNSLTSAIDLSNKSLVPVSIASDQPGTHLAVTFGESEFANYMPDANTVGLWHLEEQSGSGAYIKDSSIYNNHAAATNTQSVPTKIGQGRYFDGNGDYLTSTNSTSLNLSSADQFTASAWVYIRGNGSDGTGGAILGKYTAGTGYLFYHYNNSNGLYWQNDSSGFTSNYQLTQNQWHLVSYVRDASNQYIYADGKLVATTANTTLTTSTSNFYIGTYTTPGTQYFYGDIDEVRIDKTAHSADEIRQAYEVGLRTHPVTIDFAASLDSGNLITGSGDTSFTVDATAKGLPNKGTGLFVGEKIIVRENYDGTEYIAQGTVNSVNVSTGAVTVADWDAGGTFPSGGYTVNADVFKWQREYIDVSDTLDTHIDAVDNITWRIIDGNQGRSFWIDNLQMVGNYLTDPDGSTIASTPQQYFQYRIIETTTDADPTPAVSAVTLDYSYSLSMTGGLTSESYLSNANKNAFNVQCNGVSIAQAGKTIYCEGSWNQTNWYTVSSAASPLSNATIQGTPDVASWTGYPAGEGSVTLYVRAVVDSNPTSTYNFSVTKDTTPPVVTAITSVAADPNVPYYDVTDDSSTLVVYSASADAATCKWDESDITYTAMADTCTSTTNCTLDLSGYGTKTVYMACADTAGNYTEQINNYQLDYTIGGISMTGAQSSMSAVNNYNKTAYNIQCNGVTKPQAGTAYCYASFDQADWHEVDQTTTPINNVTLQDNVDVTTWTGYNPDGDKTIYTYASDTTNDSEIYSFNSHIDIVYPVINSITSVAGDTAAPYEDASNNASTFVVFDASADSDVCRWSTNAGHDYDTMPNSCGVAGNNCNLTLTGVAPHTAYIRCIDTHGNKQQSSLQVDYEIISEAPIEVGWLYYRDISISPATSLNNYQVKIELNPGNFDYANAQENGDDIRFFDLLGETKFDYWIEGWNTAGISEIWVEIPGSGTDGFLMEYGNSSATSESNYDNVFIKDYSHESGLSGQWLMNEGSGSTTVDSSGQGNDGTIQSAVYWRDSEGGQWDSRSDIKFTTGKHLYNNVAGGDSNNRINIADVPELDLTTGATVEMWFKPHEINFGTRYTRMISKGQEGANMYAIILDGDNKPYFYLTGPNTSANSNTTLGANAWYHLVGTYDGTDIKIYLNNELKGTTNAPGTITTNNDTLAIGNNSDGSTDRPAYGYFDDVRVYSRALTASEITAHYEHRLYDAANPQTTVGGVRTDTDDETGQENWYDNDWTHRTELTIINEGNSNTLTDYQVQLNIDTKIYINQSQMQADGDDIRFADSDGTTLMPYYVISGMNTNNTRIYVRVPSIPANNNKTIYMYYGNPAASAYQSFDNTFTKNSGFTNLAGSWHFDEGADNTCSDGDDACDDSGNGNNGIFNGAPVWQADEGAQWDSRTDLEFSTGDHLYFDGTDDYIDTGNGSSMYQAGNHLAISAWIKPTVSGQVMPIMAQRLAACGTYPNWQFRINGDNKLYFYTSNGAFGSTDYTSATTIDPNTWTHVVLVYDGVYANFYKNGQLVDRSALNALINNNTSQNTYIGTETCGNFFEGYMDEVKLYRTKLNASQVLGLYEHRKGSEPEPQAGYYRPSYEEVAGEIGSSTWESGSTIYVSGPTTLTAGSTLNIEPGTVIKFAPDAYILADGATIVAEGTSGNPIYFTSIDDNLIGLTIEGSDGTPAAGDWNGIYVIAPDAAGSFKFCDFNYGGETIILDSTTFRGQLNTKGVDIIAYNNVFNNSANADIFVHQASPDIQRNNLGDSPYGLYIEANGSIVANPVQYNSFANTTSAAVYVDGLPDTDNNGGPGLILRNNDIDSTNTGFYIDNPSGTAIRDSNAENTIDARQNSFANVAGYMCYFDVAAGNCKFDRTGGGEILFDTNSAILTAPNGGEAFFAGSLTNITWNFNNGSSNGDHVNIYLSTDSGAEFDQTIVANLKCDGSGAGPGCIGASGTYSWTVPALSSTQTRIKVVMADADDNSLTEDISDHDFVVTVIEDKLSDYRPDENAIHTIRMVIPQNTGDYINDSLKITLPNEFDLSVTAADISASGGDVSWSASEIVDNQSVIFPFSGTLNDADGVVTLTIGNSTNAVNNPTDEGSYRVMATLHDGQAGGGPALWRNATNVLIGGGLAFAFNVESALEFSIRDTGDTQDITTLDFGDINVNTIYDRSHILKVTTNAYHGYTVTAHEETDLTGNTTAIPDFAGTNAEPSVWASPPGGGTNGYYGYHTGDATLGTGDTARFAAANTWAAMTGYPYEVAFSNTLTQDETTALTYRLEVNADQPAGSYSHTVLYVCTAKY